MKLARIVIYSLALLAIQSITYSQYLSVFNIDSSVFPTMKGQFYAFGTDGTILTGLTKDDFSVKENGIDRNVRIVSCPSPKPPAAISAVLVIDCSRSMIETTPNRIIAAKAAAKAWVEGLDLSKSECAIVAFNVRNYFVQDFTDDKTKLLKSIDNLHPEGGTSYHSALIDPPAGGLLAAQSGKYKKVVIFLSDGIPNFPPNEKTIIDMAHRYNITMYCVTLNMPVPTCMVNFAKETGGSIFPNITTVEEAEATYRKILRNAQNLDPCTIEWESGISCQDEERKVVISLKNYNASSRFTYQVPPKTVASLIATPRAIKFENIPPGTKIDTTVTMIASNRPFEVTDIIVNNPLFDINPKTFSLAVGDSIKLDVSYTPIDSGYNFCKYELENNLCNTYLYASGGFKGKKPISSSIHLIHPNGREKFLVGIDTVISWEGVTPFDTVRLEYSIDEGASWINVTDSATGLSYRWDKVPNTPSNQCLMRVKQRAGNPGNVGGWLWTMDIGSIDTTGNEEMKTLGVDFQNNIFMTGVMQDTIIFDTDTIAPDPFRSKFLAKFSPDGKYKKLKYFDASGYFVFGTGLAFDNSGDIFLSGMNNNLVDVGNSVTFTQFPQSNPGNFLVKFNPDFQAQWAVTPGIHGLKEKPTESAIVTDGTDLVFITGAFGNDVDTVFDFGDGVQMRTKGTWDVFLACYKINNGMCSWVKTGGGSGIDAGKGICLSSDGDVVITGRYTGGANFGDAQTLSASSKITQMFIARYSPQGKIRWARGPDGTGANYGNKIAGDKLNNVYVTGLASGKLAFDNYVSMTVPSGNQMMLVKYKIDGYTAWAISAKGANWNSTSEGLNIKVDDQDNPVVLGTFTGTVDFGNGRILKAVGSAKNYFIACYSSDGTCLWSKRLPVKLATNTLVDFEMDKENNFVLSGTFYGKDSFEEPYNISTKGVNDIFLSKIMSDSRLNLQMDQSDSLWSIVKPTLSSKDVDFFKLKTNEIKDSIVDAFVHNRGTFPARVTEIKITGPDANDFDIVSGLPPFAVTTTEDAPVEFRFKPTKPGKKTATVEIYTLDTILTQNIRGEAIFQSLQITTPLIDFGKIETNTKRDSTVNDVLTNTGTISVQIKSTNLLGPDTSQFSIISGGGSFTLDAGKSRIMQLRFAPLSPGRTSGRIAFQFNGTGSPAIAELYGEAYELNPSILVESQVEFNRLVCKQKANDSITITNRGFKPLIISSAIFSNPAEFGLLKPFSTIIIDTNKSQKLEIVFSPNATGLRTSDLTLKNNAGKDSMLTISLMGIKDSVQLVPLITNYDLGVLCPNQTVDTSFSIKNVVSIKSYGTINATSGLIASKNDFTLDTSETINIPIKFNGYASDKSIDEQVAIADTLCKYIQQIRFTGKVLSPALKVNDVTITTLVGLSKQEDLILENTSDRDLSITNAPVITDNRFKFFGLSFPLLIPAKTSKTAQIEYTPTDTLPAGINLDFDAEPCNIKKNITVSGLASAVGIILTVANAEAKAGDIIDIPINLSNAEDIEATHVTAFTCDLIFNSTLLEPLDEPKGTIVDGKRTIQLTLPAIAKKSDEVAKIKMIAGLGNDTTTTLSLENVKPVGGFVAINIINGNFKLLDVCKEGGNRLYNPDGAVRLFSIKPNPAGSDLNVEFELIESGYTELYLVNLLGEKVKVLFAGTVEQFGKQSLYVDINTLGNGTYFIQLKTPTDISTRRLEVIK